MSSRSKETGDLPIRLLFDGNNGVHVKKIKTFLAHVQDKSPTAPDVERALRELADERHALEKNADDAHRLIPTGPVDWQRWSVEHFGSQVQRTRGAASPQVQHKKPIICSPAR